MSDPTPYNKMFSEFRITNGMIDVDLLSLSMQTGFHLLTWEPSISQPKASSVWSDSALADGSEPRTEALENVEESMTFHVTAWTNDDLFQMAQNLRYLLREAKRYWMTDYQADPVWIVRQGICESQPGYSMVMAGSTPVDDDPFHDPTAPEFDTVAFADWPMTLIREPLWRDVSPGETECLPAYASDEYCYPCHVEFDGAATIITVPDNAVIQDLADNAFTVEAWIRPDNAGEGDAGVIVRKGGGVGWNFRMRANGSLSGQVRCAVQNATFEARTGTLSYGEWAHVAMTWDDTWGLGGPRLWVNGKEVDYRTATQRNGAILSDVGNPLTIGDLSGGTQAFDGGIGWLRISDILRYDRDFTPPEQCRLPEDDGNVVGQWIGAECSGTNIENQQNPGTIDGTLTSGTFDCDCQTLAGQIGDEGIGHLEYITEEANAVITDDAAIQDLADNAMTLDGWVRAKGLGRADVGHIIRKGSSQGWYFTMVDGGLQALVQCAVTDAEAIGNVSIVDNEWHHLAMTWDDATYNYPRIWIDGVESTYASTQNRNGAIVSDVGQNMAIGNRSAGARTFDGDIGWFRVSDTVRWTSDFSANLPEQCTLPTVDGNTVWLGIQEGAGVKVYDQSGNDNHADLSALNWGKECCGDIESVDVQIIKNAYVICDGALTIVNYGDPTNLQDLHDAAMTVEAWIKADSYGGGNLGRIIEKTDWVLSLDATLGMYANIACAVANGTANTGLANTPMDGTWHHVAFTWDDSSYTTPRLWVDGVEHTNGTSNRNGAIVTDVGNDLTIADRLAGGRTFDGDIGWTRVCSSVLYTGTFTPPDRCTPWWDLQRGDCELLTIFDDHGEVAVDYTLNQNHGIVSDGEWGSSCPVEQRVSCAASLGATLPAEASETCEAINYVINSHVRRQFTHMFIGDYSGGGVYVWGNNLIGTEGQIKLFPDPPASGDRVVIGIADGHPAAQRMGNIVWDVDTLGSLSLVALVLRTGGSATTIYGNARHRDNTVAGDKTGLAASKVALSVAGINALVWTGNAFATPETVNGISGYWMAYDVSAPTGTETIPIVNGTPYTVTWPYVTIDTDELDGDEALLLKVDMINQSDLDYQSQGSTAKLYVGVRELDRGEDFTAYLLCGSQELPSGQTNTAGTNAALNTGGSGDPNAPKSECRYIPIATPEAVATRLTIQLDEVLGPQFHGQFHAYARFASSNGGTWESRLAVKNGSSGQIIYGDTVSHGNSVKFNVVDLGAITIGEGNPDTVFDQISIYWQAGRVTGGSYLELIDIFILPVDECSALFDMLGANSFVTPDYAELDSASFPREEILAIVRDENDLQVGRMLANATILALQPHKTQRLWFFSEGLDLSGNEVAYPYIMHIVQTEKVSRYWSMRGEDT